MTRTLKLLLAVGALGIAGTGAAIGYLSRPAAGPAAYRPEPVLKGASERLDDSKVLAGSYYRGDGTGYNIDLTLMADGRYQAAWRGCLGIYGEAGGKWVLTTNRVSFAPDRETEMMIGHLRALEVLKFQEHWIFVPAEKKDRAFYEQYGVNRSSCFQLRSFAIKAD